MRPKKPSTLASLAPEVAARDRPRTNLPAGVVTDQNAPVARVVPKGAKTRKVGKAVLGYDHKPARIGGSPGSQWTLQGQRLSEIEALIVHRHDGPCDTDDGEIYLEAALSHLIALPSLRGTPMHRTNAILWANRWTPRILDERTVEWFDQLEHEFATRPRLLRADTLAKLLGVTKEERATLGLTTIGALGLSKRQRTKARKDRHAARGRVGRARDGATPRSESIAHTKPWRKMLWNGQPIGRSKYYELIAAGLIDHPSRTISCATSDLARTDTCASFSARNETSWTDSCAANIYTQALTNSSAAGGMAIAVDRLQSADTIQLSLLPPSQERVELEAACAGWTSGHIPDAIRTAYVAAKRRRAVRQEDVASAIGISRPQLANALQRTFSLSPLIIENLKRWLLADDPPVGDTANGKLAKPHHRRGGKRSPPDPTPPLPGLRLFSVIEGEGERRENAHDRDADEAAA